MRFSSVKISFASLMIVLFMFAACTQELPVNQNDVERKLVMTGLLKNGSDIRIRMSSNFGLVEDTANHVVSDAVIEVYKNGLLMDALVPMGGGLYGINETIEGGAEYKFRATHPSFDRVVGSTEIPFPLSVTYPDSFLSENGFPTLPVSLSDGQEENYYLIRFTGLNQEIIRDSVTQIPIDSVDQEVPLRLISVEKIFDSDQEVSTSRLGFESFSDRFFNGQDLEFQVRLSPDEIISTSSQTRVDRVIVELRSISPEYYRFVRSYELAKPIYGGPFASFQSIYSNIVDGYGIIGGYSGQTDTLVIPE